MSALFNFQAPPADQVSLPVAALLTKNPGPRCCCTPDSLSFIAECHSRPPRSPFAPNRTRSPAAVPIHPPSLMRQSPPLIEFDERLRSYVDPQ